MEHKKNPDLDNERIKLPLIFLGFFIVGSMIMLSLEFKGETIVQDINKQDQDKGDIPEEIVVVEPPEDEPAAPELPPPDITPPPTEDIVEDENVDEDEEIDVPVDPIEDIEEEEPEPAAPIVDYPDKEAGFPGGAAAMKQYLNDNIDYPDIAIEMGDQGRVFVQFVVEKDGTIKDVQVIRGVSKEIDREAKRVVRSMPKWEPGEVRGESVPTRCRIPINFQLQ